LCSHADFIVVVLPKKIMADPTIPPAYRACPMCNDKQGMGAPPKPKQPATTACKQCLGCKTCSAAIPLTSKFSVKVTDAELDQFKETFMMFDKDGDGTVSTKELGAVMRSLGNNPTMEELEELIEDADRDGSGSVDFQEFVELMIKREAEKETQEDLKQVFRVFDKDGNGFVSTSEIKFVLSKIGVNFSDDELQEMVQEADIDGDQHVSFEEFSNIFNEG